MLALGVVWLPQLVVQELEVELMVHVDGHASLGAYILTGASGTLNMKEQDTWIVLSQPLKKELAVPLGTIGRKAELFVDGTDDGAHGR